MLWDTGRRVVRNTIAQFLKDDSGATAIEYALIAAFIALLLITAATTIGTELKATFTDVDAGIKSRTK
jgi:pilus assembly protein Flp/PilA